MRKSLIRTGDDQPRRDAAEGGRSKRSGKAELKKPGAKPKAAISCIVQRRLLPSDSLDFFPTPPWATRAFLAVLENRGWVEPGQTVWEPACGEGHMAEPLREAFARVYASDVHDYGCGYAAGSFLGDEGLELDVARPPFKPDWIITNPPFNLALPFLRRALEQAEVGVAFLARLAWVESQERFHDVFSWRPPALIAQSVDRIPMLEGRYDPSASTTMAYAWFVWLKDAKTATTEFNWIPPGARDKFIRPVDLEPRFVRSPMTHPDLFMAETPAAIAAE